MNMLKRLRPSPAMAVALIALVVAMGGTAVAGSLINGGNIKKNTVTGKQVKESTLAAVPKAKNLAPIKSGQSMSGVFADGSGEGVSGEPGGYLGVGITYPRPLATPIDDNKIIDIQNGNFTTECPGKGKAAKGYLCIYNSVFNGVNEAYGYSSGGYTNVKGKSIGAIIYWAINNNAVPYVGGVWTVTAP